MTGIHLSEKSAHRGTGEEQLERRSQKSNHRTMILTAVIAAVVTASLATSVFMAIYWTSKLRNNSDDNQEWVSWTRVKDGKILHESAFFDVEAKTGLMVSAESFTLGEDNSMALHDYNKGIVAIRDFRTNTCYVSKILVPDFNTAKKMIEKRNGKQLPIQELKHAVESPAIMTSTELGPKLTNFCSGAESHWFDLAEKSGKSKRAISIHLACFSIRITIEIRRA